MIKRLLLLLVMISIHQAHADTRTEIAIGGLFDLTAGGAVWGRSEKNAFMLACKDFEAANPEFRVNPIIEDTLFSNRQTVTALQKLTSLNKLKYIVGATWETTASMMPICETREIICISPSYHGREYYSRPWRYNFTAWFDDRGYSGAIHAEMKKQGLNRTAIFAAITPYYDSLVDDLTSKTPSTIVSLQRMVLEERDFKSMITKVPSDIDSIVMLLDNAGQIQAFLKQWFELRRDRPPVFSDDLLRYLEPPDAIERYGFQYYYAQPIFDQQDQYDFSKRYSAEFGGAPQGSSAAVAYDETRILLSCIAQNPLVTAVRECISNINNYQGASGTFSFAGKQTVRDRAIGMQRLL